MHCQLAVAQDRQEGEGEELEQEGEELEQVAVYSAVDYSLQVDRLRQNFHLSRRTLPRAALREIARLHAHVATTILPSPNNVNRSPRFLRSLLSRLPATLRVRLPAMGVADFANIRVRF